MKRVLFSLVFLFPLTSVSLGQEQGVRIHDGFGTVQEFLGMSEIEQRAYAMGAVNGMLLAPLLPETKLERFEQCIEGMNNVQVAAIIEKYVREHPERWHEKTPAFIFSALSSACRNFDD